MWQFTTFTIYTSLTNVLTATTFYMFDQSFDPNKTIPDWPIDIEVYIF